VPPVEPPQFPDSPPDGSVDGPPPERLLPPGQLVDDRPPPRATRKPMSTWDRTKFLVLAVALFWFFVWASMADNPILPFRDAVRDVSQAKWWLFVVAWLELVRQVHYVISEHSPAYHRFWTQQVFGRWERRIGRLNDWNRYRLARALKFLLGVVVVAVVVGAVTDTPPVTALVELPAHAIKTLPFAFQMLAYVMIIVLQFGFLFWFLSKGGIDTYFPDDIETRFTDVWGQDAVLERVKENMVFLEDPDKIEAKGGYVPGGVLLWGPPGTGKGQPVSAQVMTPSGPRRMGDLLPGDEVIGSDGRPTAVLEVHLLGERELYRVEFSDGSSLKVTEDHLWAVESRYGGHKVKATNELIGRLTEADGHARYRIPMVQPVEFSERELPLPPYLMGALLGDGTFRHQLVFSNGDLDVLARVELLLPDGDGLVRKNPYDWSIIGGATRTIAKELGLFGLYSYEKFIPAEYLWTSVADRIELLQGLMDTDGNIDNRGVVEFHTTSPRLAADVRLLVESLGGTCSVTTRTTRYTHRGQRLRGRPVSVIRMALPPAIVPVKVPRKAERYRPRTTYLPSRRIVAITLDGREESRCIRVAADDHLYVTEHFVVTHNTLMAEAVAGETGKPFVFVDPGAFANMFMGVGILKVKSLFRKLRKLAVRYGGVIVFFDEADALGNRGALAGGVPGGAGFASPSGIWDHGGCNGAAYLSDAARAQLLRAGLHADPGVEPPRRRRDGIIAGFGGGGELQALLTELSGLKKPRGFLNRVVRRTLGLRPKPPPKYRIHVMMASNMPQALDEALLRPGRIDRIYKVGYPSKEGRKRTYQGYLDKVSHQLTDDQVDKLATITPYATGATMKDLVNEALIIAIREGRDTITWPDVLSAKQLKQHGPPDDAAYIDRERHAIAVHEACHAVVTYRTRAHVELDMATIERRGETGGFVAWIPPEDQMFNWRSEYESDLMATLASLAGERLFFDGDNTNGVGGDLASATRLATLMEGFWGMGSTLASHGVQRELGISGGPGRGRPGDKEREDEVLEALGARIEGNLERLLDRAREILEENAIVVLAVAHALETHKTLSGDDVVAVIEGRQGPVVDGRPYHTEHFASVALAYHEAALRAHHEHSAVPVPLPSLNGHRPHPKVLVDAVNPDTGQDPGPGAGSGQIPPLR
jgi:ATP-dependent Zn protease